MLIKIFNNNDKYVEIIFLVLTTVLHNFNSQLNQCTDYIKMGARVLLTTRETLLKSHKKTAKIIITTAPPLKKFYFIVDDVYIAIRRVHLEKNFHTSKLNINMKCYMKKKKMMN